jgi:hypothetical protein
MNRRTFLTSLTSICVPATVNYNSQRNRSRETDTHSNTKSTASKEQEENWCESVTTDSNLQPLRTPSDTRSFTVTGSKTVTVYWKPDVFFQEAGFPFAYAVATVAGDEIFLNKSKKSNINEYTILHELAHNLGYEHGDGGIVNTSVALDSTTGDRKTDRKSLNDVTIDVATSFNGYNHITDWDIETLGTIGTDFAQGNTGIEQLSTTGKLFATVSPREDIYITTSHNGFGGVYEDTYNPNPENIYIGHFYK